MSVFRQSSTKKYYHNNTTAFFSSFTKPLSSQKVADFEDQVVVTCLIDMLISKQFRNFVHSKAV